MSRKSKLDQRGIVSIFVTMIMMLVISLIVIGFSQVARRNQRESLDRQESTQAFYAAESGVNVARDYYSNPNNLAAATDTLTNPDCSSLLSKTSLEVSGQISPSGVNVTCLMSNPTPPQLIAAPLSEDANTIWHVQSTDGSAFTQLSFSWASNSSASQSGGCDASLASTAPYVSLPTYTTWSSKCQFGILRVDLLKVPSGGLTNTALEDASTSGSNIMTTLYMVPTLKTGANVSGVSPAPPLTLADPTNPTTSPPNLAQVLVTRCTTTICSQPISIPTNSNFSSSEYYARLSMIYQSSANATLQAATTTASVLGTAKFGEGQVVIDSTGKDQDELRRIQVRVPLIRPESELPVFGLESTDSICKQLSVGSSIYTDGCPEDN